MKKRKRPVGRPTDYAGKKTCAMVLAFAEGMTAENFAKRCTIPHVALLLKVNTDTILEWRKEHYEFSVAVKNWQTKRDATAFEVRAWSDARWIFCMKNWTGMRDKQEIEHSGEVKQTILFQMPRPGKMGRAT